MKTQFLHSKNAVTRALGKFKSLAIALLEVKAKSHAEKNLPKPQGDNINRFLGIFKAKGQECLLEIDNILSLVAQLHTIQQLRIQKDKAVGVLRNKILEIRTILVGLSENPITLENQLIGIVSIISLIAYVLFGVAEGMFSYPPFYYLTGSSFMAACISIFCAILWLLGAERFLIYWNHGTGLMRIIRRVSIFTFCTIIFYGIAVLRVLERASTRAILNGTELPGISNINQFEVLILTAVGWLFFLGAVWLSEHTPSPSAIKEAVLQKFRKIAENKFNRRIYRLEKEIVALENDVLAEERGVISDITLRSQSIMEIEGILRRLEEEFKDINQTYRTDGEYPDCFDQKADNKLDTKLPNINDDIRDILDELSNRNVDES